MDKLINTILEGLNNEQREAVAFDKGPLLIIAGAGTGKTLALTRRIAYLIAAKKANPEEILALTFTEQAACEMEERVDILVPYGYTQMQISTFHSLGDKILNENALELGLSFDLKVLSLPEQVIFFREHLFQFPLSFYRPKGNPTKFIQAILNLISRAKDEDVSPEDYIDYAQRLKAKFLKNPDDKVLKETVEKEEELAKTYKIYQDIMAREGLVDFGDQIVYCLRLFQEHPAILKKYQDKFKYILVDEFQDTNHAQFELLKLLASSHKNICVCSDDDQSIYKFRGAALSNVMGFVDIYPDAHKIVLTQNYRSTQTILDSATLLIRYNNPDRLEVKENINKSLKAVEKKGPKITHLHYDTLSHQTDGCAEIINKGVVSKKYSYKDYCILVRTNAGAEPFLKALNMKNIPWRFSGNEGLYNREEVKVLISFLRVISSPDDSVSLYHLSSSEIYNIPAKALVVCMSYARRNNRSLFYVFSHFDELPNAAEYIDTDARVCIDRILKDLDKYMKLSIELTTGTLLYKFLTDSKFLNKLTRRQTQESEEKIQNIARFFDIIRSSSTTLLHDRVHRFVEYLDMLIQAGDNPAVAESPLDVDAVKILTVHKAKGLEFPVVIMAGLVSDHFPVRKRAEPINLPEELVREKELWLPSGEPHLQEERRLFFVGMTRAKQKLYFLSARDYGTKRPKKISQFVREALDLPEVEKLAPKYSALEIISRSALRAKPDKSLYKLIPVSTPLTLSHLQIDDYLTCPLKYKYVHILRVPIIRHHSVIFGKAIHKAVAYYYCKRIENIPIESDSLIKVFEDAWSSEGFISREHEQVRLEEGKEILSKFYISQQKSNILPTFIEKSFTFTISNNIVTGRWDRIDIIGDRVKIIDFKSSYVNDQKKANEQVKRSLQLRIYALAYEIIYGKLPDLLQLYFLGTGLIGEGRVTNNDIEKVKQKIEQAAGGIRQRIYDAAPSYYVCSFCAYQSICACAFTLQEV